MTTRARRPAPYTGPRPQPDASRVREIEYPESDGKPMGETEVHIREIIRLLQTLDTAFADRADIYVGSNLLLYYEEGNRRAVVVPDIFVAVGAPKLPARRIYKLWEEGVPPTLVIEVTSRSTRREDLGKKRTLYGRLGVADYVLYDPLAEYLRPPLQGYWLVEGTYQPMAMDADGALLSDALGLRLRLVDGTLRLEDRRTGGLLLSPAERAAIETEARRAAEARAAAAEARIAELEARLAGHD